MIRDAHTRRIARLLPDAELKIIKGDHFIAAKRPAMFNAAVEDFLNRRSNGKK